MLQQTKTYRKVEIVLEMDGQIITSRITAIFGICEVTQLVNCAKSKCPQGADGEKEPGGAPP
jgi:hypothetical protein